MDIAWHPKLAWPDMLPCNTISIEFVIVAASIAERNDKYCNCHVASKIKSNLILFDSCCANCFIQRNHELPVPLQIYSIQLDRNRMQKQLLYLSKKYCIFCPNQLIVS